MKQVLLLSVLLSLIGCSSKGPDYSGYMRSQDIPAVQLKGVNYSIVMDWPYPEEYKYLFPENPFR